MTTIEKPTTDQIHAHYPELIEGGSDAILSPLTLHRLHESYQHDMPQAHHQIIVAACGKQAVRSIVHYDPDARDTIIIHRYFGGGIDKSAQQLSHALHALVPNANIVTMPNDTIARTNTAQQDNLSLTDEEYELLADGNSEPYVARTQAVLEACNLGGTTLHFVGTSQGAHIGRAVAEDLPQYAIGSATLIEPPVNLDERAGISAAKLQRAMTHYLDNLAITGIGHTIQPDTGLFSRKDWKRYGQPQDKPNLTKEAVARLSKLNDFMLQRTEINRAIGPMTTPGVTVFGMQSTISNQRLDNGLANHPYLLLGGEYADHSIAMAPTIVAAIAARSIRNYSRSATV